MTIAANVIELAPRKRRKQAGGRPRSCNARVRATILTVACTGAHRSDMAALAGISPRTLNRFLQACENALEKRDSGRRLTKEEAEFCQFCLDFHKSEVAVKIALLEVARKGAESSPRAALAFLERRWPEEWARRRIVQVVTIGGEDEEEARPRRRKRALATPGARDPGIFTREEIEAELARRGQPTRILTADQATQDHQQ